MDQSTFMQFNTQPGDLDSHFDAVTELIKLAENSSEPTDMMNRYGNFHIEGESQLHEENVAKRNERRRVNASLKKQEEEEPKIQAKIDRELANNKNLRKAELYDRRMETKNRVCSLQKVFLTYPKCPAPKDLVFGVLSQIDGYKAMMIAQETHQDGTSHLHVIWIRNTAKKMRLRSMFNLFDLPYCGDVYHADIEFIGSEYKDMVRLTRYIFKQDKEPLVDNIDAQQYLKDKRSHVRKYDTAYMLTTPIETLVNEGRINAHNLPNLIKAQNIWKLLKPTSNHKNVRGIWYYGPAGCGKSTVARAIGFDKGGFFLKDQNKWWDGYSGEKVVIVDDLDTVALNHHLKIWADKWACKGEIKGSTIWTNHDLFIVTSNYSICDLLNKNQIEDQALLDALTRRFTEITIDAPGEHLKYDGENVYIDEFGDIRRHSDNKLVEEEEAEKVSEQLPETHSSDAPDDIIIEPGSKRPPSPVQLIWPDNKQIEEVGKDLKNIIDMSTVPVGTIVDYRSECSSEVEDTCKGIDTVETQSE